jgi:hypothetical protein
MPEDLYWRVEARVEQRIQVPEGFAHIVKETLCVPARPERYIGPSWSWASLSDARVIFMPLDYTRILSHFIAGETVPQGKDAFGRLQGGWLRMKGPLLKIQQAPADYRPDKREPLGFGTFMTVLTKGGLSYGEAFFDVSAEAQANCLALFLDPANALMLTPVSGSQGTFRRLGTAKFLRSNKQRDEEPLWDGQRFRSGHGPYGPVTNLDDLSEVVIV